MPNGPKDTTVDMTKLLKNYPINTQMQVQSNNLQMITSLNENYNPIIGHEISTDNSMVGHENFTKNDNRKKPE